MSDVLIVAIAGFAAAFVDGALGMGFGPTSSSILLGSGLGWVVSMVMLNVDFTLSLDALLVVLAAAIVITALLGALTILRAASARPARLLRDL